MPCASVYGTLVLRRLLSLSESVAHRCEKFFHGWNGLIKKATGPIQMCPGERIFDFLLRFQCFACDDKA